MFTLQRLDVYSNIFFVVPKDNLKLPLIVHGIIKVKGNRYNNSFCSIQSISDELLTSGMLDTLQDLAKVQYFEVD